MQDCFFTSSLCRCAAIVCADVLKSAAFFFLLYLAQYAPGRDAARVRGGFGKKDSIKNDMQMTG